PHLINVPLPAFKNSLEKTKELVQNVASTMSYMHAGEDDENSTASFHIVRICLMKLLKSWIGPSSQLMITNGPRNFFNGGVILARI
ncbi:unnamed protein product, partial [Prunus brigantina]